MKLSLVSETDGVARLAAEGKMTAEDFRESTNVLEGVMGPQWATKKAVLDMGKVGYMDSSAIGWLLSANKHFRQGGGKLVLYAVPPNISQLFSLLKIGTTVSIAPKEADALALASGAPR